MTTTTSLSILSSTALLLTLSGCAVEAGDSLASRTQAAGESDCAGLQSWTGNDWRLSFSAGEIIEHEGGRYQSNQAISYPNAECAPDSPAGWCAGWFSYLGECGADSGPVESCSDGVQNQGESGVDCGGPCAACAPAESCSDGVQNQGESGVDCGGPCAACAPAESCSDGVQNQGESGVDCGGPCAACQSGGVGIPAQLEAEDFVRFEESTPGHSGNCGSGPVDMEQTSDSGGGCNVGWTAAGEWLEYDIEVPAAGSYDLTLRLAAKSAGKRVQVSVNGSSVGTLTAPSGGWQSWQSATLAGVSLNAGSATVRATFLDGATNLNWLSIDHADAVSASCSDGVQNQGEMGIDCGGPCAACSGGSADSPVDYYGQLECVGGRIQGSATGAPAQVRGMSFFWSNWTNLWRADMADRMIDEFNAELIRLPFGINGGTPYSWGDEAKVEMMVERAIERGVYVIIDWHAHAAETNTQAAKDFFARMAQKYGDYDNVIFEIYNEPEEQSWSTVKYYAEEVVSVIRQYSDNLIIVGTPHWCQDVDLASADPVSASNIAYGIHFYTRSHGNNERSKGSTALGRGVCLFASEWGATHYDGGQWVNGNGGVEYAGTQEWMNWLDQNGISWANWSVMNKEESASSFLPGTENLSEGGDYLKSLLTGYAATAPWR